MVLDISICMLIDMLTDMFDSSIDMLINICIDILTNEEEEGRKEGEDFYLTSNSVKQPHTDGWGTAKKHLKTSKALSPPKTLNPSKGLRNLFKRA